MRLLQITSASILVITTLACFQLASCSSTGSSVAGNERGSQPVNEKEVLEYRRAVLKCYRTGGTRVVKIAGKLRCFD